MNNRDLSELNLGLILDSRVPVEMYKNDWFCAPYDKAIELLLQKGTTKEDLAKVLSSSYMNDAHNSVKRMNGLGEKENFDWVKALKDSYDNELRGEKFQKIGKKLKENEPVDILKLYAELGSAITQESTGLSKLDEISNDYKPFKLTGYDPIDKVLGGIPTDGPIVIFGSSGVGKSKFVTGLLTSLLKQYPNETGALYTLEMNNVHWKWRTVDLFPKVLDVKDRLYVSGSVKDIEELVAEITAKKVSYVVLDDIDNVVTSNDPGEYERVFRRVKEVCRFMAIPFFVIAQINRNSEMEIMYGTKEKGTRFLRKTDLAWTSAAEKSAALLIGLQTVHDGLDMTSDEYVKEEGTALDYIIFFKSRDGWLGDRDSRYQVGPGAVVLNHTANWTGNFYNGKAKLWSRNRQVTRIGK
jgi:hypothetical protein